MLFFGHRFLESESFYHISSIEGIKNTPPSSTLYLEFDEANLDIIEHCRANNLNFVLYVDSINDLMYAATLGASYIVVYKGMEKNAQKIAESYLFDAKILVPIEDEKEIADYAFLGIDGVIFPNAIIKVNS